MLILFWLAPCNVFSVVWVFLNHRGHKMLDHFHLTGNLYKVKLRQHRKLITWLMIRKSIFSVFLSSILLGRKIAWFLDSVSFLSLSSFHIRPFFISFSSKRHNQRIKKMFAPDDWSQNICAIFRLEPQWPILTSFRIRLSIGPKGQWLLVDL